MTARFFIFRILLAVLLLAGCTRFGDSPVEPANDGRDLVPVNFTLAVSAEEDGTSSSFAGLTGESPATKTDYEPDTWGDGGKNDAIKTVLFLQFEWQDGTEASARLIGQQFIQYGAHANLLASNAKNTVLVIANMGGKIDVSNGITLGNFLEKYNDNRIASLDDIWYVSGGNRYLRMSGSKVLNSVTPNDTDLGSVSLRRNCAKVVVKLKNTGSATVAVDKVMLRDVNKKYYYVTNYTGFTDPYQPENPQRYDLAAQLYPSEGVEGTGGDAGYRIYTYYIPANVRGSITNTGQKSKNYQARQGATYFCVHTIEVSTSKDVVYNYYLGANLTSDFNLLPNHKYTYTIDINGKGTPSSDSRIEDTGDVTFTKDANSYMLTPPSWSGATRDYLIPVRRAAVFWNVKPSTTPADNSLAVGVYGAGNDTPHYTLDDESQWVVSFVWNEIYKADGTLAAANELLVTSSGTGFSNKYFKIRVTAGMKGNAVIALKKKAVAVPDGKQITDPSNVATYVSNPKYHTNNDILWSWHIWVTDYDPYVPMSVESGTYIYSVPNGEIHRYADKSGLNPAIWGTGGVYANAFMMDRNLGAEVALTGSEDAIRSYGLYYQWGRKDPFKNSGSVTTKAADSTGEPGTGSPKQNIRYCIHNPGTFIINNNGDWTAYETSSLLGDAESVWGDPVIGNHGTTDIEEAGKSIYDPCPYGWRVPVVGVWSGFDVNNTTAWQSGIDAPGRWYYPAGVNSLTPKGRIWYPTSGDRFQDTGAVNRTRTYGFTWSATPVSKTHAQYLAMGETRGNSYDNGKRADALTVRCIRLSNVTP